MEIRDLRVGNYLTFKGSPRVNVKLDRFDLSAILYNEDEVLHYEPIELTEEILLKCGFYYDSDADTFKISNCTMQLDSYGFDGYMVIIFGEDLRLIKNLHQLQNLYFALTGEELNVQL